jgi:hypothetical protein
MNARRWLGLGVAVLGLGCGGCIESTTVLNVNKDGSGTIMVREFYSPQMAGMMSGMGDMMSGMVSGMGDMTAGMMGTNKPVGGAKPGADAAKKVDFVAGAAKGKAAKFGPNVRQIEYAEKTNKEGWKGFEAKYAFPDISKLKVALGEAESGDASSSQGKTSAKMDTAYSFSFSPGDPARLEIVPIKQKKPAVGSAAPGPETNAAGSVGEAAGQTPPEMGGGEEMGAAMMQMMAPMLKGMRMTFITQVNGSIVKTNAKFTSAKHPNAFVVMDMPMDKLLANPEAMKLMSSDSPQDRAKLAALNIPGVLLEDPDKAITVSFK